MRQNILIILSLTMSTLTDLIDKIDNQELKARISQEVNRLTKQKKFGLVFEEHLPECTPLYDLKVKKGSTVAMRVVKGPDGKLTIASLNDTYTVLGIDGDKAVCEHNSDKKQSTIKLDNLVCVAKFGDPIYPYLKQLDAIRNAPDSKLWHTLIEADNYHALQLLVYLYGGMVDCIYIDPPYNTGAKDWKYNNDYVDGNDSYRHSKWLSMMQRRLKIAKQLLNPKDSVLIVTIDEKEYLHLGCLLEEMFPEAKIQMVSSVINSGGAAREQQFFRTDEYIFICEIGSAYPKPLPLGDEWAVKADKRTNEVSWRMSLVRGGSNASRKHSPGCFYPIYVAKDGTHIVSIGEPLAKDEDRNTVKAPAGTVAIWPLRTDGSEGVWQMSPPSLKEAIANGFVRLGRFTPTGMAISYLNRKEAEKTKAPGVVILGRRADGSLITDDSNYVREYIPGTQWRIASHNARTGGTNIIKQIFGNSVFSYPKSLYAVHDTIRFFVADKPNALIVDFFAGSGTTLHAVNLLNAEDGGNRQCVVVTNNEVSADEAEAFLTKGVLPNDDEWNAKGIARYVTWPRITCSVKGVDINGKPLDGKYINTNINMSDGFKANAVFYHLGFLDKNAVALGRQFKELLPLLWLKAGAIDECPKLSLNQPLPNMMVCPNNKFAVLIDEQYYHEFVEEMTKQKDIDTVYIVTDSESGYREMASHLHVKNTYQLYRHYLDNFRINRAAR